MGFLDNLNSVLLLVLFFLIFLTSWTLFPFSFPLWGNFPELRCINISSYETQTSTVGGCLHQLQSSNCLLASFHAEVKSAAVPYCAPNLPKAIPINTKAVLKWKSSAMEAGCHSLCDCNIFSFLSIALSLSISSTRSFLLVLLFSLPYCGSPFSALMQCRHCLPTFPSEQEAFLFFLPAPFHFC